MKRIVAMLLACLLTLGLMPMALAEDTLPQQAHAEDPIEQVESLSFSMDDFSALEEALEAACQDENNREQVSEYLAELKELYLSLDTLLAWYDIASYRDVTDQAANDCYAAYMDDYYTVDEEMSQLIETVLDSPCGSCVDREDPVFSYYTEGSYTYTEEELTLYDDEQALVDAYYDAAAEAFTADYEGTDYTYEDVLTAYYSDELDYDTAIELIDEMEKNENEALVGIYLQLVENRNAQAELYGYDNAADYYDENTYYRDYSDRERKAFYQAVKTWIVPLLDPLGSRINEELVYVDDTGYSTEELLSMLQTGIENISEELQPAYDYMTENNCYDLEYSDVKADMSFTTILSEPNAPYLMMEPYEEDYDFTTLVHEFGHYNAYFCADNTFDSNIDLAEIHSQGLELLMLKNYQLLFGDKAEYEELQTIYQMLYALVDGCMIDELERYAYTEKDLTAEKLNAKYLELEKEYGCLAADDSADAGYTWVEIPHVFSSPMYYLSYGVSAAAAFTLWENSLTDYDGALSTYLELVAQGEGDTYFHTLEAAGLESPITDASMEALSGALCEACRLDAAGTEYAEKMAEYRYELGLAAAEVLGAVLILGIAFLSITIRRRSRTQLVITIRREHKS